MSQSQKIVHIGLGKCASTFLQECWKSDPNITQVDLDPLVQELRKRVVSGASSTSGINLHLPTVSNNLIATSEGMTWGWFNDSSKQDLIPKYRRLGAHVICNNYPDSRIALFIKNPINWINSAHQQAVKEGFPRICDEYIRSQESMVRHVLDVKQLLDDYSGFESPPTIFSSDELRENSNEFWVRYEKSLEIKRPSQGVITQISHDKNRSNLSLSIKRLASYIEMTKSDFRKMQMYFTAISHNQQLRREAEEVAAIFMTHSSFIHRRILEHADDDSVRAIDPNFDRRDPAPYVEFTITPDLCDHLLRNFCEPLSAIDTIPSDLVADYERSLREATAR